MKYFLPLHPASSGSSILPHVVPADSVIDPALLHFVVFIVIPVSSDISPLVSRNQGRKIFVGKVDVHIAGDSAKTSRCCSLPHGNVGIECAHHRAADIVVLGTHINFVGEPVVVGIDHGIIAYRLIFLQKALITRLKAQGSSLRDSTSKTTG